MSLQLAIQIGAAFSIAIIIIVLVARQRLGELNAASWLVIWGAIILATEHPLFAIAFSLPLEGIADELRTHPMPLSPMPVPTSLWQASIPSLGLCSSASSHARCCEKDDVLAGMRCCLHRFLAQGLKLRLEHSGFSMAHRCTHCSGSIQLALAGNSCTPISLRGSQPWSSRTDPFLLRLPGKAQRRPNTGMNPTRSATTPRAADASRWAATQQCFTSMKVLCSPSIFRSSLFTTTTPHNVFAQAHDGQRRR
jgi:hypothetical protein